jgi:prepilin-type processing-associated H-X9-DG protein
MRHQYVLCRFILPIALFIMIPPTAAVAQFAQAREKARQTQCMNNVRQLMVAVQMYMQDFDNRFPDAAAIWEDVNFPPKSLICPTHGNEQGIGYGYNFWIGGKSFADKGMPEPQNLAVIADSSTADHLLRAPGDIDNRHSGKAIIGFADGHVELRPGDQVELKPIYDVDLLQATVQAWPDGRKALSVLDLGKEGNAWTQAPPAGWVSPLFTDPRQLGGDKGGLTMVRDLALSLSGRPHAKWDAYTGDPDEVYCRIPIPADARAIAENGQWMLYLPAFRYWFCGGSPDVTAPGDPPEIRGYSEISVLDAREQPIAVFRLECAGNGARYLLNGEEVTELADAAIPNSFKGYENRYCYRYSNLVHNLLLTGYGNGDIRCLFSAGVPALTGNGWGEKLAGNIREPAWIELRVSTWGKGKPGEGAIYLWTRKQDGGILWSRTED